MNMKVELSSMIDGEAAEQEAQAVFKALRRDHGLRAEADLYFLIGDVLRREADDLPELSSRVMAALANEPGSRAPRRDACTR